MDPHVAKHLRDLYGLDPTSPNPALLFPRLPPAARRLLGGPTEPIHTRLGEPGSLARADFDSFRTAFQERAALLADGGNPIPPGHPLGAEKRTVASLRAENERLKKDYLALRKQLDEIGSDGPDKAEEQF